MLLGVITGTFGGALNDVLSGRRAAIMAKGHWLLSVVVYGAVTFWLLTIYVTFYAAVIATVLLVAGLRVLSVHLGWTSPVSPVMTCVPTSRLPKGRDRALDRISPDWRFGG